MWRVPAFDAVPTFPTLFVLMFMLFMLFMLVMFMLLAGRRMGVCGGIMKPFTGVIGLRKHPSVITLSLLDGACTNKPALRSYWNPDLPLKISPVLSPILLYAVCCKSTSV